MPLGCGLHEGVGRRPGAAEHDVRDVAIQVTGDEHVDAVPLLAIKVHPRLQRGLVGERKSFTVRRPDTLVKAVLICSKGEERSAPLRVRPADALRGGSGIHLDYTPRGFDDCRHRHAK